MLHPDGEVRCAVSRAVRNVGIAEANMVGIAAGMAACGKIVFVNSFAMFTAGRAFEQIRNSLAYPHLNVKVIGTHAGVSVGKDGATHQCLEDLAAMRSIPGMVVLSPCDANETRLMTKAMAAYDGPCFMRLGRLDVEECTNFVPGYRFEWGKATELYEGTDVTIIATGLMVQESLKARELLAQEGISAAVLDMHTIKRWTARRSSRQRRRPAASSRRRRPTFSAASAAPWPRWSRRPARYRCFAWA